MQHVAKYDNASTKPHVIEMMRKRVAPSMHKHTQTKSLAAALLSSFYTRRAALTLSDDR